MRYHAHHDHCGHLYWRPCHDDDLITIFTTTTLLLAGRHDDGDDHPRTRWGSIVHHRWCWTIVAIITFISRAAATIPSERRRASPSSRRTFSRRRSVAARSSRLRRLSSRRFFSPSSALGSSLTKVRFLRTSTLTICPRPPRHFHLALVLRFIVTCLAASTGNVRGRHRPCEVAQVRQKSGFFRIRN